jgi:two-component system response regulator HydG
VQKLAEMKRALIVDDDTTHGLMLVEGLLEMGWAADAVRGVNEAIARVRSDCHSLVVSDIRINDGDGFELLRVLREDGNPVPVILMSSFGTGTTPQQARAAGAFAYLPKPFALVDLLALVERAHREPETTA